MTSEFLSYDKPWSKSWSPSSAKLSCIKHQARRSIKQQMSRCSWYIHLETTTMVLLLQHNYQSIYVILKTQASFREEKTESTHIAQCDVFQMLATNIIRIEIDASNNMPFAHWKLHFEKRGVNSSVCAQSHHAIEEYWDWMKHDNDSIYPLQLHRVFFATHWTVL